MELAELPFETIQGEGKYVGEKVIILRFQGCIFRCSWCDSKYTWHVGEGKELSKDEIISLIAGLNSDAEIVLITGGEPLIWQRNKDVVKLFSELKNAYGYKLHVETNGYYKYMLGDLIDFIAISPKLDEYEFFYYRSDSAERVSSYRSVEHIWKFVVGEGSDLDKIMRFINVYHLHNDDIYFMPLGATVDEIKNSEKYIKSRVLKKFEGLNVKVSERRHILLGVR
jgi:organic radical activating enzyme